MGEKYLDPVKMAGGTSDDDDQSLYSGFDRDMARVGCVPPYRDRAGFDPKDVHGGYPVPLAYGSAHPTAPNRYALGRPTKDAALVSVRP